MVKLKRVGSSAGIATGVVAAVLALSLVAQVLLPSPNDSKAAKVTGLGAGGVAEATELRFDPENSVVVNDMTTETQMVFEDPAGSRTAVVSGGPVRLKDENGVWKPFDLTLVPDVSGTLHPVTSPVPVGLFPVVGAAGEVAQLSFGGASLGLSIEGVKQGANGTLVSPKPVAPPHLAGLSAKDSAKAV